MTRRRELAGLAAILALGGSLRFAALDGQGLLFFDEGQLILEAGQTRHLVARWWSLAHAPPERRAGARQELADAVQRCRILFAKPGHNAALAAALTVEPDARRATLALSALAGTLTLAAVWLAARRWFGPPAGLASALLLAVAPYHLMYSREGLSDALTVLGMTLAIALPAGRAAGPAALSGLCAGAAVTTNYRELFLPALFAGLIWLEAAERGRARWRAAARRFAAWTAGFALPLAACEAGYRALLAAAGSGAGFVHGTYAGQVRELLAIHGGQGFLWAGWAAFPAHVLRWEGALSLAVLLAVLAPQCRRWRGADGALNLALLAPWCLFSAYWDNAPRFFAVLLPLAAAAKARWLLAAGGRIAARPGWPAWVAAVPVGLVAALALPRALALAPRSTPYHEAARLLAGAGDPRHLSSNPRLGLAYFGPGAAAPLPATRAELATAVRAGWRWAVVDLQIYFGGFDRPEARLGIAEDLARRGAPALDLPYPPAALAQFVLEQDLTFRDAREMLARLEALAPRLRVWDLAAGR